MNPLKRTTPIDFAPPGWIEGLNRNPPREGGGCGRIVLMVLGGVMALGLVCGGVLTFVQARSQPVVTIDPASLTLVGSALPADLPFREPPPATLDDWSLTGTAIAAATASPTIDYCWWQTPTAVPSATGLPVTPDAWALQGTAWALATGTPTATPLPTQPPPRAWCDSLPTPTAPAVMVIEATREVAADIVPTQTRPPDTPVPTRRPAAPPVQPQPVYQSNGGGGSEPVVVVQTQVQVVVQTQVVIQQEVKIITATPLPPTQTATATQTFTPETLVPPEVTQEAYTDEPTATESSTPTASPSATNTPSETPVPTETAAPEPTQTFTPETLVPPEVTQEASL